MDIKFDIYIANTSNTCRYVIGNIHKKPLFVIGLNPSIANQFISDNTITKINRFATINSFDSFVVFNLYPIRATKPKNLPARCTQVEHKKNLDVIFKLVSRIDRPVIWAAWGNTIIKRNYLFRCLYDINQIIMTLKPKWLQCGTLTKEGHPRHPSRLGYINIFSPFDIDSYLDSNK